ncbi:MAG: ABC transporter substrate-binding protein [Propionibacteriaceae bacterium]|jgi:branched-chain amino acid transport system substrate-binding protein|nr:ABC transporter substrate-binding protein [Propionibacteriaceae bacterium]
MKAKYLVIAITAAALLGTSACAEDAANAEQPGEVVKIAALYPATGQYAEYGKMFEEGFELALEKVNAEGGVKGKTLDVVYYDTQSDAKQDAAIAPQIAADPDVIAVVGDYASGASKAASPTFQQAGLIHYAFNNSAASFTDTGDKVWSPAIGQDVQQAFTADTVAKAAKRIAVVYIENDWGKEAFGYFKARAEQTGTEIVYESSYLADSTDLSPILIPARDSKPDAIVQIGYGPDGALVINTLRDKLGYTGPYYGGQQLQEYIDLAGANAEGSILAAAFINDGVTDPKVVQFVEDFKAKYGKEPGGFQVTAYQAIIDLSHLANLTEPTRDGIFQALQTADDIPLYLGDGGTFTFNQTTRKADNILPVNITVKDGKFVRYDG